MKYTISELAKEFQLTTRTIRYYEELQLLKPKRSAGNQRIYSNKDYTALKLIIRGKKLGFSLEAIKDMILLFDRDPTGQKQLERAIQYGDKRIEEVSRKIDDLLIIKEELEKLRADFCVKLTLIKGEKE